MKLIGSKGGRHRHLRSVGSSEAPAAADKDPQGVPLAERIDSAAQAVWDADPSDFLYSFRALSMAIVTAPIEDYRGDKTLQERQRIADGARYDLLSTMLLGFVLRRYDIEVKWDNARVLTAALIDMAAIEVSVEGM